MEPTRRAVLTVPHWAEGEMEVQYNPSELTFEKAVQLAEIGIPGLDAPLQQFVRGQAERLSVELFFDTTDQGMGAGARSVTHYTDLLLELVKVEPSSHAPPVCTFTWGSQMPGANLSEQLSSQRRQSFTGVVERVRQRFTLFSPDGVPLRARVNLTIREYRPLEQQLREMRLSSPDLSHSHAVRRGETLAAISHRYYRDPAEWRRIAAANGIDDPRYPRAGSFLAVPPIERGKS
jgi:hypothetical protein